MEQFRLFDRVWVVSGAGWDDGERGLASRGAAPAAPASYLEAGEVATAAPGDCDRAHQGLQAPASQVG